MFKIDSWITNAISSEELLQKVSHQFGIPSEYFYLTTLGGRSLQVFNDSHGNDSTTEEKIIECRIKIRICGGKGGFGANLRRQGSKMGKRVTNFDSCRDLSGRRLRVLNDAKKLAEHMEKEKIKEKERQELIDKKIEEGLNPVKKKVVFDDPNYFREKEEIQESLRQAVKSQIKNTSASASGPSSTTAAATSKPRKSKDESADNSKGKKKIAWISDDEDSHGDEEDEDEIKSDNKK